MEDPLVPATWTLAIVTGGLVVATVGLVVFSWLQWRAAREAGKQAGRQVDVLAESLEISRRTLAEAELQRAAGAPFALNVWLVENLAGNTTFNLVNAVPGTVMRIERVLLRERPSGSVMYDANLAEGTIGSGEGWSFQHGWDASRIGATLELVATGHRIGGPVMTIEFLYRVNAEGQLDDLQARNPQIF